MLTLSTSYNSLTNVAWSPEGTRLATTGRDATTQIWDSSTGRQLLTHVERKFLEPVARYLAILQEWSLERLSDGTGTVPPEQP